MTSTNAQSTIDVLRHLFAVYGLPLQLVSDNGPQFVSAELSEFLQENGVKHIRSAPNHPASNGLAERFVRSFKEAMKAAEASTRSCRWKLENFLLKYRTTPHGTTGRTPASLFLGRNPRTRLDLLKPNCGDHVLEVRLSKCNIMNSSLALEICRLDSDGQELWTGSQVDCRSHPAEARP